MSTPTTMPPSLQTISQYLNAAAQHASIALCQWTHDQVVLSVQGTVAVPLEEVSNVVDFNADVRTIVIVGSTAGHLVLSFDNDAARRVAALLLHRTLEDSSEWSLLEISALSETGNIVASAFLNELSRAANRSFELHPPVFIEDYIDSVFQQVLLMEAAECEQVIVCRARCELNGELIDWDMMFVPSVVLSDPERCSASEVGPTPDSE